MIVLLLLLPLDFSVVVEVVEEPFESEEEDDDEEVEAKDLTENDETNVFAS
jgi:hypothetical protein